jgi:metallophosphoesterase (TIGR00282 family)
LNILYVGDVMGEPGILVVERELPRIKQEKLIDLVIAQGENVTGGRGISPDDFLRLQAAGVDFCTGGNWTVYREDITPLLADPDEPIIRPANYPEGTPGLGYKSIQTSRGNVLVISLLGHIVGKDADKPVDNPLEVIDHILREEQATTRVATVVNFHGDFSSEKRMIGYYLDGKVSAVVGDHWHVPTADAMILPHGTAHQSDVGMCGALDSSLGIKLTVTIKRWQTGSPSRNELELEGRMQFNALLITVDELTGLASSVESIQKIL